ncbi:MCE family protein [bacterium]|nr:MCE family protein [bacterium]
MSTKANYFKIGAFVIAAATILVVAIVILGAGALFKKRVLAETYIDQSVQGLDIGSPVRYRGVLIGNVKDIDFVHNVYPVPSLEEVRYVLVRFRLDPSGFGEMTGKTIGSVLAQEVNQGLRMRMSAQGLTGSSYLEMDYMDPERNPPLEINWNPECHYIPSAPSTISRMSESVETILRKIEKTQFEQVALDLHQLLTTMDQEIKAAELPLIRRDVTDFLRDLVGEIRSVKLAKLHDEASALLTELSGSNQALQEILRNPKIDEILTGATDTIRGAQRIVADSEGQVEQVLTQLNDASAHLNDTARELQTLIENGAADESLARLRNSLQRLDLILSGQQANIARIFENLSTVSEDLKELVREAKKHPSGFLFGEPPPAREGE